MRAKILLFHTNFDAELLTTKIKKGFIRVGDLEFPVSNVKHFNLKTALGTVPLYIFKWNSIHPVEFDIKEVEEAKFVDEKGNEITLVREELEPITELKFKESGKLTPELIRDITEIRFLRTMKRYVEEKAKPALLPVIIAFILGLLIAFMLFSTRLLVV